MKILNNKIFIISICLISLIFSGLIVADKVFGVTVKSNMDMYYGKIINLGTPTNSNDAATKNYVDSAASSDKYWQDYNGYEIYPKSGYLDLRIPRSLTLDNGSLSVRYAVSALSMSTADLDITQGSIRVYGYARNNDDYTEAGDIAADDGIWAGGRLRVGDNATIYRNLYLPGGDIQIYGSVYDWYGYAVDFQDDIDMHSNKIKGVAAPSYSDDAANKNYVDSAVSSGGLWRDYGSYIYPTNYSSFVVTDSGYVGIGTSNPYYKLDVSGDTRLNGNVGIGTSPSYSYPLNVYGNSYLNGNVGIGTSPSYSYKLDVYGNTNISGTLYASTKNFIIDHPLDPENKQLIHSTLEGPEIAVFYRGEGQLQNGKAEVVLPDYFEALTRKENRTVLLTPMAEFDEQPISNLAYFPIKDGKFKVKAIDNNNPSQKFSWEVKAIRADIPPLEVERFKNNQGQQFL